MIVLAVLAVAAVGLYFAFRPTAAPATGPSTITRDVQASTTTLTTSVGATGTMQPAQQSNLSFSSAGTVTSVTVAVGDKVSAGQTLAALDLTNLQSNVDAAQAAVDAATDDVTTANNSGTTAAINAANSTLKIKQNALDQATTALAGGTLTAPFDGTVAAVNVKVGDSVGSSGGGNSGAGTATSAGAAITVITADQYVVSVGVGSADIGKITKGLKAEVTPSGAAKPLSGTVTGVGVIASTSQGSNTASFPVTVTLDEAQTGLYAGISANVSIVLTSRPNVLVVPSQAVTVGADGTATVQKKQADGTYVTTPVKTGQTSGSSVEITSGLAAGDTVEVVVVVPGTGATPSRGAGYGNNGGFPGGFPDTGGGPGVVVGGGPAPGVQVTNYQSGPGGAQRTP